MGFDATATGPKGVTLGEYATGLTNARKDRRLLAKYLSDLKLRDFQDLSTAAGWTMGGDDKRRKKATAGPKQGAGAEAAPGSDPFTQQLAKISAALLPFAETCHKNDFGIVFADQAKNPRTIIDEFGKTLVSNSKAGELAKWIVLHHASVKDSGESDAEAKEWADIFAPNVTEMIACTHTDITEDLDAEVPLYRPLKKVLRVYANDKVQYVTITNGDNSSSSIKYSYIVLQLPEEFAHYYVMLFKECE